MDKVIVITGPTGVGKTKLAIRLAQELNTEIINGDAFQIYKGMNIGTAMPTVEEQSKVKHHLFSFIPSTEEFSVADYQRIVRKEIQEFIDTNKIPLIVGGSGLYIDSVISNYSFDNNKRDEEAEKEFDNLSNEELYQILKNLSEETASKIHMNNRKRVARAIENLKSGNYSTQMLKNEMVYDALVIFLSADRAILYDRINQRVDQMINDGLVDEVKNLYLNNQFSKTSIQAIGYKELIDTFNGKISQDEAIELIKKSSRHYAKRQITWFKHKPYCQIINVDYDNIDQTYDQIKEVTTKFLNK